MTELSIMITTFVDAIAMLMAIVFVVSLLHRRGINPVGSKAFMGIVFSLALIASMSDPILLPNNAGIFDMRALLVGTATALLGPFVGLVTLCTGIIYRSHIGNPGVIPAIVGMVSVFAAGWVWHHWVKDLHLAKFKKALILGAMLTVQANAFLVTPPEVRADIFFSLFPYMVASSLLGAILITYLMTGELSYISEAQASQLDANTDHLTGLLNRRGLNMAYQALADQSETKSGRALLYFDVDRFKQTNDSFGHAVGDDVLRHVVNLVASNLRTDDVFVRLGGDEFAVILPNIDAREAEKIAERCREVVDTAGFAVNLEALPITISVGAVWMRSPTGIEHMLETADQALYEAKSKGRNAVVFLKGLTTIQRGPTNTPSGQAA